MNPLLPASVYVPDAEARVWDDGRLYLYGSLDIAGDTFYCSPRYRVYSSANLETWTDHGISFEAANSHQPWMERLFAPDCVFAGGKYRLFYCGNTSAEGVASSTQPHGPFTDPRPIAGADGDSIDPAVLVDEDGAAYLFWGQFHLRAARLRNSWDAIDPETFRPGLLTESRDGFHEGASIRKINGIYYLVYTDTSRGKATCLAYATSRHPLGPYEKQGILIDNDGCDPDTWNNHGSICQFQGRWLVFYHRSSHNNRHNRRVCAEPLVLGPDGRFAEAEMTTQGASGPLDPRNTTEAWRACRLERAAHTRPLAVPVSGAGEALVFLQQGSSAAFKYFDFPAGLGHFQATASSATQGGRLEIRLDSPSGPKIADCPILPTGSWDQWRTFTAPLLLPSPGRHALWLKCHGPLGRPFDLLSFSFT